MNPTDDKPIIKNVIHAGKPTPLNFKDGTKSHFHYQARICNSEKTLLDDSRKLGEGKPIELIMGKKFKLEVWEAIIKGMHINEVAQFKIHKSLVAQYPFVSKTLRDAQKPKEARRTHCCAMTLQSEGIGYDDLNKYIKQPEDIEFTIELLKVEQPEDYEKEVWQLTEKELLESIPKLKEEGNKLYKLKNYKGAAESYAKALGILEQLMIKEKPHEEEWNNLNQQKLPILLNYSQCILNNNDYYGTIEHCSTVIKYEPDNVKAYFRRAKAHVGAWNPEDAKQDFLTVVKLDPTLKNVVKKELDNLESILKTKKGDDKEKMKNLFG